MDHKSGCSHTNCNTTSTNPSLCQTLSEMDWERSLWNAAFSGEKERVQQLIDKSRNPREVVNAVDKSGYTSLHYAARNGHLDICRMLLQNGAFINAQTRCGGATPLHKAAAAGKEQTVKFLIESGASLQIQDVDGKTVIDKVVENGHSTLVDMLLEACPDLKNKTKATGNHTV